MSGSRTGIAIALLLAAFSVPLTRGRAADVERNWARQGVATQSSTLLGGEAKRANDGNENGDWNAGSVSHTASEADPYWQIDLGAAHYIDEIRIHNRTDCCAERLNNFAVFFVNNKEGFKYRDFASTTTQTSGNPSTGVYFKPVFFQAGDIDPVSGKRLSRHTIKVSGADCSNDGNAGCLMRFVRIQLAGSGTLSLAEVEVIEKAGIPGPAAAADAVAWTPTDVSTDADSAALLADDDNLMVFFRGADKRLHQSIDLETGPLVVGSPTIGRDAPAAVWDESRQRAVIAVRTELDDVSMAEVGTTPGTPVGWTVLGKTTAAPALAIGCDRIVAAWIDGGQIRTAWRSLSGSSWTPAALGPAESRTPPTLATNVNGVVGMSFLRQDGIIAFTSAQCDPSAVKWAAVGKLNGVGRGDRASLVAYGPHFVLSVLGNDNRGYVAIQATSVSGRPQWLPLEPIPASQRGDPGLPLLDTPRLFVMSGTIVAVARDRQTKELRYWIKFPNRLASGDPWMGGRVVGGSGATTMSAVLASVGRARLWGAWNAPAELYAVSRVAQDQRLRVVNLGRFIAKDVLLMDLSLTIGGMSNIDPQPDRDLDVTVASNIFEQMVAVLSLPNEARTAVIGRTCGNPPLTLATSLALDRGFSSGQQRSGCPFQVIEGTAKYSASALSHEWMHVDSAARNLPGLAGFADTFKFKATGLVPSESGMKACTRATDCGGDACELAGDNHGGTTASTKDFDPAETELRRWDDTKVCVSDGGPEGRRYQGGLSWYDVGTADHAFIHMAIAYRWYGDDLRDWVAADTAHGNTQLQRRYDWVKSSYFHGVEYNGRMSDGASAPRSDRSRGFYGKPSR